MKVLIVSSRIQFQQFWRVKLKGCQTVSVVSKGFSFHGLKHNGHFKTEVIQAVCDAQEFVFWEPWLRSNIYGKGLSVVWH